MSSGRTKKRRNEEAVRVAEVVVSRFVSAARLNIYDLLFDAVQPFSKRGETRTDSATILEKSLCVSHGHECEKGDKS